MPHHVDRDCTTCHMPARRTQDVVHVVMTDHFIRRTPGGAELLAPREEREPLLENISFLRENEPGPLGELYRLLPLYRALGGSNAGMVDRLGNLLMATKPPELEPYLDLAAGLLRQRRYGDLEKLAVFILERAPNQPLALEWLAVARAGVTRRSEAALPMLEQACRTAARPEAAITVPYPYGASQRAR
jgi:hypothetical protein